MWVVAAFIIVDTPRRIIDAVIILTIKRVVVLPTYHSFASEKSEPLNVVGPLLNHEPRYITRGAEYRSRPRLVAIGIIIGFQLQCKCDSPTHIVLH